VTELRIRLADYSDLPRLAEISRSTWEGSDYLEKVAARWISEGGLFVGEVDAQVIGAVKVTRMPSGVIWLEGLRVHPDFRSRGFGRRLVEFAAEVGRSATEAGEATAMEFATYVHNSESIAIAADMGFHIVEGFYIVTRPGIPDSAAKVEPAGEVEEELAAMGEHLSAGWTFVRNTPEGREWLLQRVDALRCGSAAFLAQRSGNCYIPLGAGLEHMGELLDGVSSHAAERGLSEHSVIVPQGSREALGRLSERGYESWDELSGPNMLVFSSSGT